MKFSHMWEYLNANLTEEEYGDWQNSLCGFLVWSVNEKISKKTHNIFFIRFIFFVVLGYLCYYFKFLISTFIFLFLYENMFFFFFDIILLIQYSFTSLPLSSSHSIPAMCLTEWKFYNWNVFFLNPVINDISFKKKKNIYFINFSTYKESEKKLKYIHEIYLKLLFLLLQKIEQILI